MSEYNWLDKMGQGLRRFGRDIGLYDVDSTGDFKKDFRANRDAYGAGEKFGYKGKQYTTDTADDLAANKEEALKNIADKSKKPRSNNKQMVSAIGDLGEALAGGGASQQQFRGGSFTPVEAQNLIKNMKEDALKKMMG